MKFIVAIPLIVGLAAPVLANGDADAGKKTFGKCKACHEITSDSGETIAKGGKTGPNLWGVIGRTAGTVEGFRYGDDLVAAGAAGLVWNEETLIEYVSDPRKFLQAHLDDKGAKSKMTFKLRKGGEDIYAYLAQFGPVAADAPLDATAEQAEQEAPASE